MFVLIVEFIVKADHLNPFRERILQQAQDSLVEESECHQFDVCFDPENSLSCILYEKYTDRSAFNHHLATPHFLAFDAEAGPWVESKSVRVLESIGAVECVRKNN